MRARPVVATVAAVAAVAGPAPAGASFPGGNGDIVAVVGACEEGRRLVAVPWMGGALRPVTPECETREDHVAKETINPDASPDGETIIALQLRMDDGLVTMAADGSARQLVSLPPGVSGREPSFAPDGRRFAFSKQLGTVAVSRLDGTGYRRLTPSCMGNCVGFTQPRWSPDGRLLAVEVNHYGTVPKRPAPVRRGIWLSRAADGRLVRRIAGPHAHEIDWAPDGRSLVYRTGWSREEDTHAAGGNLYRVGRDGRDVRQLVHRKRMAEVSPSWSPDGRWIAWVSLRFEGGGDVSYDVIASLWRVRVRGGKPERIARLPAPWVDGGFFDVPHITWLPRG
jgi:dipeptidyl aminopeptidase/acylaminoacyl peptidase